jgi:hypothetical protein
MKLVKYFHISVDFFFKLFPKHFQIKKIIKLMLQVLVSLICTQASESAKEDSTEVVSVCQDLLDNSVAVKCDIIRLKTQMTYF